LEVDLSSEPVIRRFRKGGWLMYETIYSGETRPKGMSADAIADVVATYARPFGWHLAPHDLRRTFAKLARSGQAPLEQIQLALGHQSIQTTQRYLGSELDPADAACDRLGIRVQGLTVRAHVAECRDIRAIFRHPFATQLQVAWLHGPLRIIIGSRP
jgi:hypothetical protein